LSHQRDETTITSEKFNCAESIIKIPLYDYFAVSWRHGISC